jgi:hypothetical protein
MPLRPLFCSFVLLICVTCAYAQPSDEKKPADSSDTTKTTKPPVEEKLPVKIILAGGSPLVVDEVSESSDGYWYKRGNVTTFIDRDRVARIEYPKPPSESVAAEQPVERPGRWSLAEAVKVKEFFQTKFNKPLPLSTFGQSDLHTRWGLDHRNGMDVNLHPDSVEGRALIAFLKSESIPFLAFRGPIPGVSTGPHIHVGNRSPRSYGR